MKRLLVWLLGGLVLAGGAYAIWRTTFAGPDGPAQGKRSVTVEATTRDFVRAVLATGTVKPEVGAQVNVGARLSGKVEKLQAAIGDRVTKGALIAVIEHEDLLAQVAQREAELAQVQAQIDAARSRLAAELKQADTLIGQRFAEVAAEQQRLVAVESQRQRALATEEERLESVRQQLGVELDVAQARILESESEHKYTRKDVARMETLFKKGMLPEQSLDKAVAEEGVARSRLRTSRESLSLARTRKQREVAVQEEAVKSARALLEQDVAVQRAAVHKAEAALAVAEQEKETAAARTAAELQVLQASLPRLESELQETRIRLSYAEVRAPIDGVVGTISTQEGETVAAGFNAPTFVTVVDLSRLQVDAYVDEVDIGRVQVGQPAGFTVDAFPDVRFSGKVTAIYPSAILLDNVVYYDVVISIEGDYQGRLRPEMTANVTIEAETRKDSVAVPIQAVRREDGEDMITVKGAGGTESRTVEVGLEDGDFVEILSGVSAGEEILYETAARPVKGPGKRGRR